jgi:hypothetical protein
MSARSASASKTPETKHAALVDLNVQRIRVTVRGDSPLITHAWSEKAIRMIEDKQQKKAAKAKEAKNPEIEMAGACYRNAKGEYCIPARAFKCAMVSAATSINDKTFPKTLIRQALFVQGDLLPIISKHEPDKRTDMVRLNGSTADVRYRPEWKEWAVELTIQYNATIVSEEQVVNLLKLAGFAVGVGEWRPEKNGNNGRFSVV